MHSGGGAYGDSAPATETLGTSLTRHHIHHETIEQMQRTAKFLRDNAGLVSAHGLRRTAERMLREADEISSAAFQLKIGG